MSIETPHGQRRKAVNDRTTVLSGRCPEGHGALEIVETDIGGTMRETGQRCPVCEQEWDILPRCVRE